MADKLTVLIGADDIARRVASLGREISADYGAQEIVLVGVLKGCFVFMADLIRHLTCPVHVEFLRVASYGSDTESSGVVEIRKDIEISIAGRDVLIVEDIVDTGLTLDYIRRHLGMMRPHSVRVCTLLDKPARRRVDIAADYTGFTIGDQFVVGYGLDYAEKYRQCDAICSLEFDE